MKFTIVYWTRYGNNKKIVDYLEQKLDGDVTVLKADEAQPEEIPQADYYIFSSAAERFSVQKDMRKYMKSLQNMDGKKYAAINTHAMKKSWLKAMNKILVKKGMVNVAETDFRIRMDKEDTPGLEDGWEQKLDMVISKLV